jgi:hypothetical protein
VQVYNQYQQTYIKAIQLSIKKIIITIKTITANQKDYSAALANGEISAAEYDRLVNG